jgi:hypothetical protein
MRCIWGEFGWYRVGWSTYGDGVVDRIMTFPWHKFQLEVLPKHIRVQRQIKYWTFVVWMPF